MMHIESLVAAKRPKRRKKKDKRKSKHESTSQPSRGGLLSGGTRGSSGGWFHGVKPREDKK